MGQFRQPLTMPLIISHGSIDRESQYQGYTRVVLAPHDRKAFFISNCGIL